MCKWRTKMCQCGTKAYIMGTNARIADERTKKEALDNRNYFCDTTSYEWPWGKVSVEYDIGQAKVCITHSLHELTCAGSAFRLFYSTIRKTWSLKLLTPLRVHEYTTWKEDRKYNAIMLVYVCANVTTYTMTRITWQWDEHGALMDQMLDYD